MVRTRQCKGVADEGPAAGHRTVTRGEHLLPPPRRSARARAALRLDARLLSRPPRGNPPSERGPTCPRRRALRPQPDLPARDAAMRGEIENKTTNDVRRRIGERNLRSDREIRTRSGSSNLIIVEINFLYWISANCMVLLISRKIIHWHFSVGGNKNCSSFFRLDDLGQLQKNSWRSIDSRVL